MHVAVVGCVSKATTSGAVNARAMSEYGFTHPISVRMSDVDANRHVNNTVYFDYLQEARARYFRSLWDDDWNASSVVVANVDVDFRSPVGMDDDVLVDVRVSEVGTSSWTVEYRVRAVDGEGNERVAAEGSSVQVAWDREAGSSQPLPESWREKLEGELATAGA